MHGRQTLYTNRACNSLQFGVFYGMIFYDFVAQLKLSGRVYTHTAVSGLNKNT